MNDGSLQENKEPAENEKHRTIEEFVADATELVTRRGNNPQVLIAYLKAWQADGYNPQTLSLNILSILTHQRRELNSKNVRSDASIEQLKSTIAAINDGSLVKHFEDTITARQLVEWCENYISTTTP